MSIETTPNLGLPQWTADEKPSFLAEINQAWADIDKGFGELKVSGQGATTVAQAAQTAANNAVTQSNANSSAITLLQQEHAQLEADFVDSAYINATALNVENVPSNIRSCSVSVNYNKYSAYMFVSIGIAGGTYSDSIDCGTITDLPFILKTIEGYANLSYEYNGLYFPVRVNILNTGVVRLTIGTGRSFTCNENLVLRANIVVPITILSNTREALVDNCLYIAK